MRKRVGLVAAFGAALTGLLAVARISRRWFPVRVAGESMAPVLSAGDWLAVRAPRPNEPGMGQIIVLRLNDTEMVKRVVPAPSEQALHPGTFWVEGENAGASTDSRTFGAIERGAIVGVVRARYKPLRKARRFR